jgi:hypothetical protein
MGAAKPDVPSDELMLEMFKKQPTALLLDEFQTWYDSLPLGLRKEVAKTGTNTEE